MHISFHTDPADIAAICSDLAEHGAVFIATTRPRFKEITRQVEGAGTRVLSLATRDPDGDFHHFLLRFDGAGGGYQIGVTETRVCSAIRAWRAAGSPLPHVGRV